MNRSDECRRVDVILQRLNHQHLSQPDHTSILLAKRDIDKSQEFRRKHAIVHLPVYMGYISNKLVYASDVYSEYGCDYDAWRHQCNALLKQSQKGLYLPNDFKFSVKSIAKEQGIHGCTALLSNDVLFSPGMLYVLLTLFT